MYATEYSSDIRNNMGGTYEYYAEWKSKTEKDKYHKSLLHMEKQNRSVVIRGKWQEMGEILKWFVCLNKLSFKRKKSLKIDKIKKKRVKNINSSCIYKEQ